jgi:hypothetical protein
VVTALIRVIQASELHLEGNRARLPLFKLGDGMMHVPNRRFRFGLRTLFAIMLVAYDGLRLSLS